MLIELVRLTERRANGLLHHDNPLGRRGERKSNGNDNFNLFIRRDLLSLSGRGLSLFHSLETRLSPMKGIAPVTRREAGSGGRSTFGVPSGFQRQNKISINFQMADSLERILFSFRILRIRPPHTFTHPSIRPRLRRLCSIPPQRFTHPYSSLAGEYPPVMSGSSVSFPLIFMLILSTKFLDFCSTS